MAKSKEQCINIISENFNLIEDKKNLLDALEESIKEICEAEYGLLWSYNEENESVENLMSSNSLTLKLSNSLLNDIINNKKGIFDNHIASHRKFNQILDNPLKIKIKSILLLPVLTNDDKIIGVIAAYNSMDYAKEFQRYTLRCLELLNVHAIKIIKSNNLENVQNFIKIKKSTPPTSLPSKKVSLNSEKKLDSKDEKIKELEKKLNIQKKIIDKLEEKESVYEVEIVNDDVYYAEENNNNVHLILDFLSNEITCFSNENHKIYQFLEIIKNSLHNQEQLAFINHEIDQSQLIQNLANELYKQERLTTTLNIFNSYSTMASIANLYTITFLHQKMLFNVFIDPKLPSEIRADEDKIKSLLIHLINNTCGLIENRGVIELLVSFSAETKCLNIEIKGFKAQKVGGFFRNSKSNHSLITSNTGVGLSICSNLVNLLDGKLKLSTIGKDEYSFMVNLPIETVSKNKKVFHAKKPLKIGILLDESNLPTFENLKKYFKSFGIVESNLVVFRNVKKINGIKLSHLICFENMLSQKINMGAFDSVTVMKYLQEDMRRKYNLETDVNELLINSYYGMVLQKILFPDIEIEDLNRGTLIKEETFLGKLKRLYS